MGLKARAKTKGSKQTNRLAVSPSYPPWGGHRLPVEGDMSKGHSSVMTRATSEQGVMHGHVTSPPLCYSTPLFSPYMAVRMT